MKKISPLPLIRWVILISLLVLTTVLGRLHQIVKLYPPIDAFCPFGGLESAWALIRYQGLLKRTAWSSVILLATSLGTALIFRRSFCGNICPLGFLQELFGLGGGKILHRRFNLPGKLDRTLRYLKYPVMLIFLGLAWKTFNMTIRPYDPWVAYHHIGSGELLAEYFWGTIILLLSLLGGIFLDRPFCRYLCPMGAFLALPSKIGMARIKRNGESCIDCGLCDRACPMALSVSRADEVLSAECIACGECVRACPVPETLAFAVPSLKKKRRPLPSLLIIGGTFLIFLLVLAATSLSGSFSWKSETGLEPRVERLLWGPQRIKGDNTLADIVQIYQIHPAYFAQELNLDREDQFYLTLDGLGVDPDEIAAMVTSLYEEAGMDPRNVMKGGGRGHSGGEH